MFAIQPDRKMVTDETAETINMPRNASLNITGIPDQMKVQFEEASGTSRRFSVKYCTAEDGRRGGACSDRSHRNAFES